MGGGYIQTDRGRYVHIGKTQFKFIMSLDSSISYLVGGGDVAAEVHAGAVATPAHGLDLFKVVLVDDEP